MTDLNPMRPFVRITPALGAKMVIEYVDDHRSIREISERHGPSASAVRRHLLKAGVKIRNREDAYRVWREGLRDRS